MQTGAGTAGPAMRSPVGPCRRRPFTGGARGDVQVAAMV